ncbi:hypothetical protein FPHOBKDP_00230 [Listeria phage LPJP1]|nr:hypothetical protein FPHOBKDP_00230 [Listeria phage LPJP1]
MVYDVVIKIDKNNTNVSILNSHISFYSNNPNFMFTYGYIYNRDGLIIDWLKNKMSIKSLVDEPKVRNPNQIYGFEKSVYFALIYLEKNNLLTFPSLERLKPIDKIQVSRNIPASERKLVEIERYKNRRLHNKKIKDIRSKGKPKNKNIDKPKKQSIFDRNKKSKSRRTSINKR